MNELYKYFEHENLKIISYSKNDIIKNEGQYCDSICIILKGEIEIISNSMFDDGYLVNHLGEGDNFGESLIFSSKPYYLGYIIATKDCQIAFVTKDDISEKLSNDNDFRCYFISMLSNKTMQIQARLKTLCQRSIREKILFYLYEYSKINKTNVIPISSKERLASYLNVPRPSLSRELIELKKLAIIDYDRKSITILAKGTQANS